MANRIRTIESGPLVVLVLAAVLPAACAGADANTPPIGQTPYASASAAPYGQPPPYASAAPPGYPAQPTPGTPPPGYAQQPVPPAGPATAQTPLGPIVTTDPAQLQAMFAQAAQAAQAFLQPPGSGTSGAKPGGAAPSGGGAAPPGGMPGGMPTDLVDAGIKVVALMEAKGMQPEGNQAKGQLAEGGHLEFMVPMQAGKCYTLIGFSPPGQIRNLDLNLLAPPFYNMLAGQDASDDNTPVIGKSGNPMCPIVPVPLNYKVDIVARAGSGQVGVQLFSRLK
jgi:hypothetical protein